MPIVAPPSLVASGNRPLGQSPSANETIGGNEIAREIDREAHAEIGDAIGQHVRCVGDRDAARSGRSKIDMVGADTHAGDDLELRQRRDQRRGYWIAGETGEAADPICNRREKSQRLLRLPERVDREFASEPLHHGRHRAAARQRYRSSCAASEIHHNLLIRREENLSTGFRYTCLLLFAGTHYNWPSLEAYTT